MRGGPCPTSPPRRSFYWPWRARLWSWKRFLEGRRGVGPWFAAVAAGVLGGCSALCKLNGILVVAVVGAWAILALGLARISLGRKLAILLAALVTTALVPLTFVALNPFLTAHPLDPCSRAASRIASLSVWLACPVC